MNVEQIKQTSKTKYLHSLAKLAAKEKYQSRLVLISQGGSWRITPEFIGFLSVENLGEKIIIIDMYENPVLVDRNQLLTESTKLYADVMSEWLKDSEQINRQR